MTPFEIARAKIKDVNILDSDIELALLEVETVVRNYCNIEVIPEALYFTVANMAVSLATTTYITATGTGGTTGNISSLRIGDTQIQLGKDSYTKANEDTTNALIKNNIQQLNKFRRMVW
jgi:hypothetical protein